MRALRPLLLGTLLVTLAMTAARPACAEPTAGERLRFFRDVGLTTPESGGPRTVLRWDGPIGVSFFLMDPISTEVGYALSRVTKDAVDAGLPLVYRSDVFNAVAISFGWTDANIASYTDYLSPWFGNSPEAVKRFIAAQRAAGHRCPVKFVLKAQEIIGGLLLIDSSERDVATLRRCAARGMAGLLGLGPFTLAGTQAVPSIANPSLGLDTLTEEDRNFLRFFFGKSVHSGMSEEEFTRAARQALRAKP